MKSKPAADDAVASAKITARLESLGDWRSKTATRMRELLHAADPEIIEEWKWVKPKSPGTPVFFHDGIICTLESYKQVVKLTFARGAAVKDPKKIFNSSLEGNVRRAIDIKEGDKVNEAAFKALVREAVAVNARVVAERAAKKKAPKK
jgi:hypothetical protein